MRSIAKFRAERRSLAFLSIVAAATAASLSACGGDDGDDGQDLPPGFYITISGMRFSPLDLAVPPGATVTVLNRDSEVHSVTSQSAASAFTPGGVAGVTFDTGLFLNQRSFTIPTSAPEGTVIPYYCTSHLQLMATPNGTITIRAASQPTQPPGGGKGGGY